MVVTAQIEGVAIEIVCVAGYVLGATIGRVVNWWSTSMRLCWSRSSSSYVEALEVATARFLIVVSLMGLILAIYLHLHLRLQDIFLRVLIWSWIVSFRRWIHQLLSSLSRHERKVHV